MNRITIICLILSFLFYFGASSPTEPSIVIRKPVKGNVFSADKDIPVKICPGLGVTKIGSIALVGSFNGFFDPQTVNIAVQPGKCITFKFHPSKPPSIAPYFFEITFVEGVTTNLAVSATFTLGRPKVGLIITHPVTDTIAHCGGTLKIKWKDPFKLYGGLTFSVFSLFEASQGGFIPILPPAVSVPVSAGKKTVKIPLGLKNEHNYNVVVFVVRNSLTE
ncbi:10016_t:CDS:2, partial [Paraglomus occultum]